MERKELARMLPMARKKSLVVEPIGDELLVFDSQAQRAHSLNPVAATVWRACDGTRDVATLATATGLDPEVVELALANLRDCDLLTGTQPQPAVSRRQVLRRAALTGAGVGLALPVIRSIAAPTAAMAATSTCAAAGSACTVFYSDTTCTNQSFDNCQFNHGPSCFCQTTGACAPNPNDPNNSSVKSGTCG